MCIILWEVLYNNGITDDTKCYINSNDTIMYGVAYQVLLMKHLFCNIMWTYLLIPWKAVLILAELFNWYKPRSHEWPGAPFTNMD